MIRRQKLWVKLGAGQLQVTRDFSSNIKTSLDDFNFNFIKPEVT